MKGNPVPMKRDKIIAMAGIFAVTAFLATPPTAVAEELWIDVVNETDQKIKVVAPGGVGFVEANAGPVRVAFKSEVENGDTLIGWWVKNPRQLCKIYARWGGQVFFNGTTELRCRAH